MDYKIVRLTNGSGAYVEISNIGAGIIKVVVPDRHGNLDDVILGYANPADYMGDGPCAGKIPGRFANRIAAGKLTIAGKHYELPVNCGPNHLHGGPEGFQNKVWVILETTPNSVKMQYSSPDGEMGYPGNLIVTASYLFTEDNELQLTLEAKADAETVINLTNHAYWNLDGENSGNALHHTLRLFASRWLPTDNSLVPDGSFAPVDGTPMNFLSPKEIGQDINEKFTPLIYGKGYDNCWAVDDADFTIRPIAELSSDNSGRKLLISSDQPAAQVYSGNWLSDSPINKAGGKYNDYDGIAIECQDFPDAPNRPEFPSTTLLPGEKYCRHINFKFSTF